MDVREVFEAMWAGTPHDYPKDIAYAWFLTGWDLSQKKGEDVIIDKTIGFLQRMKS